MSRQAMVIFSTGIAAMIIKVYAITIWVIKLRQIGSESTKSATTTTGHSSTPEKITDTVRRMSLRTRRIDALLTLLHACILSVCLQELINSTTLLALQKTPLGAQSVFELTTFGVVCRVTYAWGLLIPCSVANAGREIYGSEKVFDWWIGLLRGPLDLFERIHIGGKQIASMFYYAS